MKMVLLLSRPWPKATLVVLVNGAIVEHGAEALVILNHLVNFQAVEV